MNVSVKLWFVMDKELTEVAYMLEKHLGLKSFMHDDEDTWEWCISTNNQDGIAYDISRKHIWEKGIYDYPIGVYVKKDNKDLTEKEIECLGRKISRALRTKVYMGKVEYIKGNEFEFNPYTIFDETDI